MTSCIPVLRGLSREQAEQHAAQVELFLRRKRYIGCGGLVVNDDMRLSIAAYACLLVLRPGSSVFPALKSILIYPEAFYVPVQHPDELGLIDDAPQARIGESWRGDRVILSWQDVLAARAGSVHNVVVHEFAHQLDDETPGMPGVPALRDYRRWSQVMHEEFDRLRRQRRPPVLDPYGAESPAEFFAVATEAYVQRPVELLQHHPALFELLASYYRFSATPHGPTPTGS